MARLGRGQPIRSVVLAPRLTAAAPPSSTTVTPSTVAGTVAAEQLSGDDATFTSSAGLWSEAVNSGSFTGAWSSEDGGVLRYDTITVAATDIAMATHASGHATKIPVTEGETVTGSIKVRQTAGTTGKSVVLEAQFYDEPDTIVTTVDMTGSAGTTTGTYQTLSGSATVPATAVRMRMRAKADNTDIGDVYLWDDASLLLGTGSPAVAYGPAVSETTPSTTVTPSTVPGPEPDRVANMTGITMRHRAGDLVGAVADGGSPATWPGLVGPTLPALESGGVLRYSVAELDGQPAVELSGTGAFGSTPPSTLIPTPTPDERTMGVVVSLKSVGGAAQIIGLYGNTQIRTAATNSRFQIFSATAVTGPVGTTANTGYVATGIHNAAGIDDLLWVQGSSTGATVADIQAPSTTNRNIGIGGNVSVSPPGTLADAYIAEVVVWDHPLDATERAAWHSYVQDRYGLTVVDYAGADTSTAYAPEITLGAPPTTTVTPDVASSTAAALAPGVTTLLAVTPDVVSSTAGALAPGVTAGSVTTTPNLVSSTVAGLAPTVTTGAVTATPNLASSTAAALAPSVTTPLTVTPGVASSTAAALAPSVTTPLTVTPGVASSAAAALTPTVAAGAVTVTPGVASSTVAVLAPVVTADAPPTVTVTPDVASSTAAVLAPTVTAPITVTPGVASSTAAALAPSVAAGSVTVTPNLASSTAAVLAPSVDTGDVTATPGVASSTAAALAPVATTGAVTATPNVAGAAPTVHPPNAITAGQVVPDTAFSTAATLAPTVTRGAVTATPGVATSTPAVHQPTLSFVTTLIPGVATSTAAALPPTVTPGSLGSVTVTPDGVATIFTAYGPVVTTVVHLGPGTASSAATVLAPTVTGGAGGGVVTPSATRTSVVPSGSRVSVTPGPVRVTSVPTPPQPDGGLVRSDSRVSVVPARPRE